MLAPDEPSLLGLVSVLLPPVVAGNAVVLVASEKDPRTAVVFAEALATSDIRQASSTLSPATAANSGRCLQNIWTSTRSPFRRLANRRTANVRSRERKAHARFPQRTPAQWFDAAAQSLDEIAVVQRDQNDLAPGGDLTEAQARSRIVAYCALLWERRLVTGTSGNVSVRLEDGDILVTPAQCSLRALSEDDSGSYRRRGGPQDGRRPTSELPLHLAAYAARPRHPRRDPYPPDILCRMVENRRDLRTGYRGRARNAGRGAWTPYAPPGSAELARLTSESSHAA